MKERRYSDRKNAERLDPKFENLDVNNSNPISSFKGCNIVDLSFVCQQLIEGFKACKTTLSLTQCQKERLTSLASISYLSCQNCNTVTMMKTSTWHVNENTKDGRNARIYDVNTKCAAGTYTKFLL